ncbi:uncharacterized protein LOC110971785 [Tachysurus ichikawai]
MGESDLNISNISNAIDAVLPDLPIATKKSLEDTLKSLGVETPRDFRFLEESDLAAVLRPIQARKFISVLKETTQISENPKQTVCSSPGSFLSQSSSCSSPNTSPPSVNWEDSFEVPWNKFPEELMQALERQKRPIPRLRREMRNVTLRKSHLKKRAAVQDTYGCINWELQFMPLSETAESQQLKKEKMRSLLQTTDCNEEEVKVLMKSTYYSQRKDINKGTDMKILTDDWPFLFQESGMEVHFKDLTGIPLKETFLNSIDGKGNRLLNFMRNVCATKNKHVLQAITKLQVLRGQTNGCSEDVKDMILLLLSYFDEKEELLLHYVEQTSLAKDVELENLPVTPCIIVCGRSCYAAVRFLLSVDRKIVNDDITTFIAAVCLMFGSYYCFNIHYPSELASVLEFLQRCFFNSNPEKGTKVLPQV